MIYHQKIEEIKAFVVDSDPDWDGSVFKKELLSMIESLEEELADSTLFVEHTQINPNGEN